MFQSTTKTFATFLRDMRLGVRRIRRSPSSSAIIIATLGIGIGLSAVVFMFADVVLFRPLPYPEPTSLVTIDANIRTASWVGSSEPEALDIEQLESFDGVAAFTGSRATLAPEGDTPDATARRVRLIKTTSSLFSVLDVSPVQGRTFSAKEDQPGGDAVVVISYGFWRDVLGGRTDIVGSDLRFGDTPHQVIGIMPRGFHFPSATVDAWTPLALDRANPWGRNNHYLGVVARLKDNVTLEGANTELDRLAQLSVANYPEIYGEAGLLSRARPTQNVIGSNLRQPTALVLAAVGLLLLLTCANVANIQLARGAARLRELSVRTSLGASRRRLVAQLMTESLVLALVGGTLAVLMALVGQSILPKMLPADTPRIAEIALDLRVLTFTLFIALLTTLIFGLWPALRSTRGSLVTAGSNRHQGGSRWLRSSLVVAQMAVAVLLLVGCGMLARSLQKLGQVDPGFDPEGVLVLDVGPPGDTYDTPEKVVNYYQQAEELLASVPGVDRVGSVARLPLASGLDQWSIELEGQAVADVGQAPSARVRQVTSGYFEALGLHLRSGRLFDTHDRAGSQPVIVINQAMADEHWPSQDALGQRMRVYDEEAPFMTVVGIVGNIRDSNLAVEGLAEWYVPHAQAHQSAYYSPLNMTLVLKTNVAEPLSIAANALTKLRTLDARVALFEATTYRSIVRGSLGSPRLLTIWLALFAGVAVLLGAAGLYGLLSYGVTLRKTEIGVRLSVGAEPMNILRSVLAEGILLCTVGFLIGGTLGIGVSRLASSVLFEVGIVDPWVLGAAGAILLLISLAVPLIPALRASRVDPARALLGTD